LPQNGPEIDAPHFPQKPGMSPPSSISNNKCGQLTTGILVALVLVRIQQYTHSSQAGEELRAPSGKRERDKLLRIGTYMRLHICTVKELGKGAGNPEWGSGFPGGCSVWGGVLIRGWYGGGLRPG